MNVSADVPYLMLLTVSSGGLVTTTTGATSVEPNCRMEPVQDWWDNNSEIEYERLFHDMLTPWDESDLQH